MRLLRIDGDVATVNLTQGKTCLIDTHSIRTIAPYTWYAHFTGYGWYAAARIGGRRVYMHDFLMPHDGEQTDHRNRDSLDNRLVNLRPATRSQNTANRGRSRRNTTGFKGVRFDPDRQKYRARIRANGVEYHLGRFATAEDAHLAYAAAAARLFGDFACTG